MPRLGSLPGDGVGVPDIGAVVGVLDDAAPVRAEDVNRADQALGVFLAVPQFPLGDDEVLACGDA